MGFNDRTFPLTAPVVPEEVANAIAAEEQYAPFEAEYSIEKWNVFRSQLQYAGYTRLGSGGNYIDRNVAHSAICPVHGTPSSYVAYYLYDGNVKREYRAFAVCYACDKGQEF
jgi:hypothetical protein